MNRMLPVVVTLIALVMPRVAIGAGTETGAGVAARARSTPRESAFSGPPSAALDSSATPRAKAQGLPVMRTGARGSVTRQIGTTHIAGEVPVPQVLFITARDPRRFTDFHHARYLKSSRELADGTLIPSWMTVTHSTRREISP